MTGTSISCGAILSGFFTRKSRVGWTFVSARQSIQWSQDDGGVSVTLAGGETLRGDLLVGADGVHSTVRAACFGQESQYVRYLGRNTGAYIIDRPGPMLRLKNEFYTLTVLGKQVGVYPIRGNRLATFFVHAASAPAPRSAEAGAKEMRACYRDLGWIVPDILDYLDARTLYFDSVSQIRMPRWSSGRVALLGDAAYCVSLLAGQGASLAMAGAYILAEELSNAAASLESRLARYEQRLRPAVEEKQEAGRKMAKWFVPEDSVRLMFRDFMMSLSGFPPARPLLQRVLSPSSVLADEVRTARPRAA